MDAFGILVQISAIIGSISEGKDSKELVIRLSNGRKVAYLFQSTHDALLFR